MGRRPHSGAPAPLIVILGRRSGACPPGWAKSGLTWQTGPVRVMLVALPGSATTAEPASVTDPDLAAQAEGRPPQHSTAHDGTRQSGRRAETEGETNGQQG
ncbi:hypothetical protein GCM10018790_44590 [Kitasatospora xanthocidica]|nr:hypothetical protein GCM10018790_44590 [Kitasatospora xanthocidica]